MIVPAVQAKAKVPPPRSQRARWLACQPMPRARIAAKASSALLFGALLAGCGGDIPPADPSAPSAAVTGYYRAIEHHQLGKAASYVAAPARNSVTSENGNIVTLTQLRVTAGKLVPTSLLPALPVATSDYSSFAQVVASFKVRLHKVIDSPNGPQTWFAYLGKSKDKRIGWQILSVGSGP
jgi:hypothetical protein